MISIIIPYFKITYFEETLRSLAKQTDKRFEVFIGDDASPNDPLELLGKYEGKFNYTYKRFKDNLGRKSLTKQWQRCLDQVHTEWFMILGDDDSLAENAIEEFYKSILEVNLRNCTVLRFSRKIIGNTSTVATIPQPDIIQSTDYLYKRSRNEVGSSLSEYVFRLEEYNKFGIRDYPSAFYSDNMMVMEYSRFSCIKTIQAETRIRISEESLSGNRENSKLIEKAGWLFYWDIVTENSKFFTTKQLSLFLNIIMRGVVRKQIDLSKGAYIRLCAEKIGWLRTIRKLISMHNIK